MPGSRPEKPSPLPTKASHSQPQERYRDKTVVCTTDAAPLTSPGSKAVRAAHLSLDLEALLHNFQRVKQLAPQSKVMPVIKANAYGHGMLQVAQTLDQADGFAVAQLSEAVFLREHGITQPISVFQGFADEAQLVQAWQLGVRPAISQSWQLQLIEKVHNASSKLSSLKLDLWVKVNTGMGRLGLQAEEVSGVWERIKCLPGIGQLGLMMHFANADHAQHPGNQQQLDRFAELVEQCQPVQTSVSNSAAIMSQLYPLQDWVRPGIMLYGASPLVGQSAQSLGLKPVMQFNAQLIAINALKQGEPVGYGYTWVCPEDMPVGIVNIGYADGYPRHAPSATPVMVNAQRSQLIGRVSMDSIAVDLRHIKAQCGDTVQLWGQQLSVDEVAQCADTISYELLCHAGSAKA